MVAAAEENLVKVVRPLPLKDHHNTIGKNHLGVAHLHPQKNLQIWEAEREVATMPERKKCTLISVCSHRRPLFTRGRNIVVAKNNCISSVSVKNSRGIVVGTVVGDLVLMLTILTKRGVPSLGTMSV